MDKLQRAVSGAVLPAVPNLSAIARPTPKSQKDAVQTGKLNTPDADSEAAKVKTAADVGISLGSPKPKGKKSSHFEQKDALSVPTDTLAPSPLKKEQTNAKHKSIDQAGITQQKKTAKSASPSKDEKPVNASPVVLPAAVVPEVPEFSTPASGISEVPGPRPRTLRLTTTGTAAQKPSATPAEQALASADKSTPAATASVPARDAHHFPHLPPSRQHSISSAPRHLDYNSRPSTPMSDHSHSHPSNNHSRMISEVASRSSTPPAIASGATIVGSAPERTKTKAQAKKERREKAKTQVSQNEAQTSATASPANPIAAAPIEVVAPIVAKQKKQKKEKVKKAEPPVPAIDKKHTKKDSIASEPYEEVVQNPSPDGAPASDGHQIPEDTIDEPEGESPALDAADSAPPSPLARPTLAGVINMAAQAGAPDLKSLLLSYAPSARELITSVFENSDTKPQDHPLLNPPPFASSRDYRLPPDSRRGQDYLDAHGYTGNYAFGMEYYPRSQRRELLDGAPIVAGEGWYSTSTSNVTQSNPEGRLPKEDLLKTSLITPTGTVMRHLTSLEIDRALDLEEQRAVFREQWGDDLGGMQALDHRLETNDQINLEGGVEELIRHGESKGVVWVYDSNDDGFDDEDDLDDDDIDDVERELLEEDDEDDGMDEDNHVMLHAGEGMEEHELRRFQREGDQYDKCFSPSKEQQERAREQFREQQRARNAAAVQAPAAPNLGYPTSVPENKARERMVNLRAMSVSELQARLIETAREVEASKKEMDRMDKIMAKRSKELSKWREANLKGI